MRGLVDERAKCAQRAVNVLAYVHLRNIVNSTGAGRVAKHLTENIAAAPNVTVHILADAGDHRRLHHELIRPWTDFSYHFFESDTSAQQVRWALRGKPEAEQYWTDADIIYCAGESYVPTRAKRLVVTVHDAAIFEKQAHRSEYSLFRQRMKWRVLYALLARKADLFHTVSQYSADRISHYFPAIRSRLRVVHNAAPERFFMGVSADGESFLEQAGLKTRPYILIPGGLHYRKNADLLLRGIPLFLRRFPDYRVVIAGHCERTYVDRANALGTGVLMTGFVDDESLCSLYHGARAVWFPSKYEGFGVPVLEAMACGAPVVTSTSSALPEIAGDAALLVSPDNVDAYIEALAAVCDGGALRDLLILRGVLRARQFTWQASASKLVSCFRSIL